MSRIILPTASKAAGSRYPSIHTQRLERWLGPELMDKVQRTNYHWPVALGGAPGDGVMVYRGEAYGRFPRGAFASYSDYLIDQAARRARAIRSLVRMGVRSQIGGFSSLSDLISEATVNGKGQQVVMVKAGTTGVVGVMNSLARVGSIPAGQATAAAFAAGESPTATTPSGLGVQFFNPAGGDTTHVVSATVLASVANQLLLLYDRFYQGNWNVATTPQSVSGTPSRYQDTSARGTFISSEVSTALGASATGTITITYVDSEGNTAEAMTSLLALVASSIVNRFPHATPNWFYQFNSPDVGARSMTNLTTTGGTNTGNVNLFMGYPLCYVPLPNVANQPVSVSFVNTLFSMPRVYDSACLCLLELFKSATTATNWFANFQIVSG